MFQLMDSLKILLRKTVGKSRGKRFAFTRFAHRFNPLFHPAHSADQRPGCKCVESTRRASSANAD